MRIAARCYLVRPEHRGSHPVRSVRGVGSDLHGFLEFDDVADEVPRFAARFPPVSTPTLLTVPGPFDGVSSH